MSDTTRFDQLAAGYLEGDLTPQERAELEQALTAEPHLADQLVGDVRFQSLLKLAMERKADGVSSFARRVVDAWRDESKPTSSTGTRPKVASSRHARARRRAQASPMRLPLALGALAAAAAVLIAVGTGGTRRPPRTDEARDTSAARQQPKPQLPAARADSAPAPDVVAAAPDARPTVAPASRPEPAHVHKEPPAAVVEARLAPVDEQREMPTAHPAPPAASATVATATHVAYVDAVDGAVERSRAGGDWGAAHPGDPLAAGDRLRTKTSRAHVAFESGSRLHINHWTTLTFATDDATPGVSLVGGEVYVEVAKRDTGFFVETPHGRARDLGTRFGVESARSGTVVRVVEGAVEGATDEGAARVEAGQQVLLARRTSPPGPVQTSRDMDRKLAWAKRGGAKELFAEDFDRLRSLRGRFAVGKNGTATLVEDGSRCIELSSKDELSCLTGALNWRDYTVTARLKILASGANPSAALWAHYGHSKLNYRLRIYEGRVLLYKRDPIGGSAQSLVELQQPAITFDVWYRMRFELRNTRDGVKLAGKVWPDGQDEPAVWTVQHTDATPQVAARGGVGLFVQRGTARFDDFKVVKH